ncbi:hypothetical protein KB879_01765 [Cupriavidus sp. KK10]|uniref:hypothetical protein n=1 Tax=Cupriavidus sp. KK10 TaxID=1478019 RepID=UPI001BAC4C14|nr:hypothetical protein [Cupriavidus sp. KK10]QUN28726.1 hypothetical protein KB879_01765 [Cupriavidus sp. KK10]
MPRARNIKHGLFRNEILGLADPLYTLLFEGLWLLADREGRLEDRPLRIKADVFPYRDAVNLDDMLNWLYQRGFITRYTVENKRYIAIVKFRKHQNPHKNEPASTLPGPDSVGATTDEIRTTSDELGTASDDSRSAPADSLIPDSLSSDSLIPDSLTEPDGSFPTKPAKKTASLAGGKAAGRSKKATGASSATWEAYAAAYFDRYGVEPVRNATVNGQLAHLVGRIGGEEAPHVARYYVGHNATLYVRAGHPTGLLVRDAEKLRMEWATHRQVPDTPPPKFDPTEYVNRNRRPA